MFKVRIGHAALIYGLVILFGACAIVHGEPRYGWDQWDQRPAAPSNLEAEVVASNAIRLTWKVRDDRARWFHIEDANRGVGVAYVGGDTTEFTHITALEPGTTRRFKVRADNNTYPSANATTEIRIPDEIPDDPIDPTPASFESFDVFFGHFSSSRKLIFVVDAARGREQVTRVKEDGVIDDLEIRYRVTSLEDNRTVINEHVADPGWMEGEQRVGRSSWYLLTTEHEVKTPELDGIYQIEIDLIRNGRVLHTIRRNEKQQLQFAFSSLHLGRRDGPGDRLVRQQPEELDHRRRTGQVARD